MIYIYLDFYVCANNEETLYYQKKYILNLEREKERERERGRERESEREIIYITI